NRVAIALDHEVTVLLELARVLPAQALEVGRRPDVAARDRGRTAGRRRTLEHEHACTVRARRRRGRDAGEPRPEDDDVSVHQPDTDTVRARNCSISAGTTVSASPTMPRSASWKIGASRSLLIAITRPAPPKPTVCCGAPLMPTAM